MIAGLKGSSVQLPSYNLSKYYLVSSAGMPADSFWTFLAASSVSGVCVCIAMQPPDTVRPMQYRVVVTNILASHQALTRMYNR